MPLLAALIGIAGVFIGLWLSTAGRRTRLVVPFSAGVLLGVVLFGLLPELVEEIGWPVTGIFFAAGYGLLYWINRHVAPVCPSCAHDHDHQSCGTVLHGFAAPLIGAMMLHAFLQRRRARHSRQRSHAGGHRTAPFPLFMYRMRTQVE